MEISQDIVATKKEALRLLGIKEACLPLLERAAGIRYLPDRNGYTPLELKRLLKKMKKILAR